LTRSNRDWASRLHFRFTWPATTRAAGAARRTLEVLPLQGPVERVEELRLLVSEVVTNAVLHAGLSNDQAVDMLVEMAPGATRVEIQDRGRGFEPMTPPRPRAVGGLGMVVVDQLSRRWGVAGAPHFGVWFELDGGYRASGGTERGDREDAARPDLMRQAS
jgi:anti-sigma regulatory factor (Ser/Thr protein kinase)